MPDHPDSVRRSLASRVKQKLSEYGLENAVVGGKYDELRQEISEATGYWARPTYYSKPSRLIVHLESIGGVWRATTPAGNGNFAYANTAGHRSIGCIFIRVIPQIKVERAFAPHPNWEWILYYCFSPKLRSGSSGEVFSNFEPAAGTFTYLGTPQPYIAAGLITLRPPDEVFIVPGGTIRLTYREATEAIRQLIHARPSVSDTHMQDAPPNE